MKKYISEFSDGSVGKESYFFLATASNSSNFINTERSYTFDIGVIVRLRKLIYRLKTVQ